MKSRGAEIEGLLASEDWTGARRAIRLRLRHAPDDHWLLSRLALTYYEQRKYKKALEIERQALRLAPRCPLALLAIRLVRPGLSQAEGRRFESGFPLQIRS